MFTPWIWATTPWLSPFRLRPDSCDPSASVGRPHLKWHKDVVAKCRGSCPNICSWPADQTSTLKRLGFYLHHLVDTIRRSSKQGWHSLTCERSRPMSWREYSNVKFILITPRMSKKWVGPSLLINMGGHPLLTTKEIPSEFLENPNFGIQKPMKNQWAQRISHKKSHESHFWFCCRLFGGE